jgi:tRNA threonylcarbamoyladenosine biosynthesis protein TsaB
MEPMGAVIFRNLSRAARKILWSGACRVSSSHLPFPGMTAAPVTLAIETSGQLGGVALGRFNGEVLWRKEFPTGPRAGGGLFLALEECLAAGPAPGRILVGVGPGSYAGVRMGIAAATGLGLALGLEPIAVPSVCAYDVEAPSFHALGDARRGAYYYTEMQAGRCARGPEICDEEEVHSRLADHPDWPVYSGESLANFPMAQRAVARAARLLTAPIEDARRLLEPIYLREPHITRPRVQLP